MRVSLLRAVAFAAVVALLGSACGGGKTPGDARKASGAASGVPAGAASKATLLVASEDVREVVLRPRSSGPVVTGSIQPARRADLRAEVSAVVLQLLKDNGDAVKAGELLLRLDATSIRDNLASAEESNRAASQAHEQAERTVQRLKSLQAQGMTSLQALEDAEVRRNAAHSELLAARARVAAARQQLARTEVRAPFDGVVSERRANAGDTAAIGKELIKVIDPRSMRFEGQVSADRLGELKLGQKVSFRVNGVPGTEFSGTVQRLDASANAVTRQVEVLIAFAEGQVPRVAGLYAEGRIETGSAQVLMLPESALVRAGDSAHAWRLKGQQLQRTPVQLGERDERSGEVVVRAGLEAGDRVLRRPGDQLADGQAFEWAKAVAPVAAPAASAAAAATAATAATAASAASR
jgi:membrane fusion protein, multidrug efflux system